MMAQQSKIQAIPRPLVRAFQSVVVLSVLASWILGIWYEWSYYILLIPFLSGLSALLFHFNPVFRIARKFLRKPPGEYHPEDPADQRFNQVISTTLLGLSFLSFLTGYPVPGYVFSAMVFIAASVAILGFCVGCYLRFHLLRLRAARQARKSVSSGE